MPLRGFAADFLLEDFRAGIHFAKVFLEVHARRPGFARTGEDQHAGGRILLEGFQDVDHFPVQGRAHGVAFFRTIENDPGDAFFDLNLDCGPTAFVIAHGGTLLFWV